MDRQRAETIALRAAAFLFSDERARDGFLAVTGADPASLRDQLQESETLTGLLDYLLSNEPLLLAFCAAEEIEPEEPGQARSALAPEPHPND